MDYQWYPGHMTRARRQMQEDVRLVDLVIELTDARTPLSGRNPDLDSLAAGKQFNCLKGKSFSSVRFPFRSKVPLTKILQSAIFESN